MIPKKDMDYVIYYAEQLKKNNKHFRQQKMLIDSQIKSSRELFAKRFGTGEKFRKNARRYLKESGII